MTDADERGISGPSQRRIKRQVLSRTHSFFAAAPPGLESMCREELAAPPVSVPDAASVPGGVRFSGKLEDLYRASLHLRTANRILMRVARFRAESFRELRRQIEKVDWTLFLPQDATVQVRAAAGRCRLYHTGAVAQRVKDNLDAALGGSTNKGVQESCTVFVRCEHDRFTLSVDSSGELLHRRGIKTLRAAAPIRETLAAAILTWAGFDPAEPMLDPMCGSGTFSLEAAMIARRIPPGWYRRFAFEAWPAFRPRQWRHLRKEAQRRIVESDACRIFASDRDAAALVALGGCLSASGLDGSVSLFAGDFFDLRPERFGSGPGLVVLNPPYGRRLSADAGENSDTAKTMVHLMRFFKGWKVALVSPPKRIDRIPFPHTRRRLLHGGLTLTLVTGRIPGR